MSAALASALQHMFSLLSADGAQLTAEEERRWLVAINRSSERGSEMRCARALREQREAGALLSRRDFLRVYHSALQEGKYWSIEYDLRAVTGRGLEPALQEAGQQQRGEQQRGEQQHTATGHVPPARAPYCARFDYLFFTPASLRVETAGVLLSEARMQQLVEGQDILPCSWHPSDHIPVMATFQYACK